MIPRFSPDYRFRDFCSVLSRSRQNATETLEREFAKRSFHEAGISFRYGRSGLYYLLKALGASNRKVILPSYTCVVVAHAIRQSGNIPVFLDNEKRVFQPSPDQYLEAIDRDTAMVIPTHLFGIAEETAELYRKVKAQHPYVFVLQDCAHSYFCRDSNDRVVTQFGDGAMFGMNISKLVNSVRGGMLTLRDPKLASEVKRLRVLEGGSKRNSSLGSRAYVIAAALGFTRSGYELVHILSTRSTLLKSQTDYYSPHSIELPRDYSVPMLDFEAEIGLRSLGRFDERVKVRAELANSYLELLKGEMGIEKVPRWSVGNTWSHFPVTVEYDREDFRKRLERTTGAEIGKIVDYSVADLPAYRRLGASSCPNALHDATQVINLPLTLREGLSGRLTTTIERFAANIVQRINFSRLANAPEIL